MRNHQNRKPSRGALNVANCTNANLRKATRIVAQVYDAALRPVGLRGTQFTLLATMAESGDTPMTRLADELVMDRTTLTRNLKPLVEEGFVRVVQEEDHRVRIVRLTGRGKAVLEKARHFWREAQSRLVGRLGRKRWSGLLDDLVATIGAVQSG